MASGAGRSQDGLPGAFDFAALQQALNDPAIKQMAEQIASDPAFMEVTKQMQTSFASMMGPSYPVPDSTEKRPTGINNEVVAPGGVPDPSYYMNAMTAKFDDPEFMTSAEQLGKRILENDPNMDLMRRQLEDPERRSKVEEALQNMREDPELAPMLADLEITGPLAMMRYWSNPEILSKLGMAMGGAFDFPSLDVTEIVEHSDDDDGEATVLSCASAGEPVRMKELIDAGANVDEQDEEGRTALHFACGYGEAECARILIAAKADLNKGDSNKNTALHYSAGYAQPETAKLLMQAGADGKMTNKDGKTALEVAKLNGQEEVVAALTPAVVPTPPADTQEVAL